MTLHYMDGGPFETKAVNSGRAYSVLGYDPETLTFLALSQTGETFWGQAVNFAPPPPIPAAARKPEVGDVRMWCGEPVLLLGHDGKQVIWIAMCSGTGCTIRVRLSDLDRPATPEEAEPFRPLLKGLKASLGEKA